MGATIAAGQAAGTHVREHRSVLAAAEKQLLVWMAHRLPRYAAIAERWGVTVEAAEVEAVRDPQDFVALVAEAIARR